MKRCWENISVIIPLSDLISNKIDFTNGNLRDQVVKRFGHMLKQGLSSLPPADRLWYALYMLSWVNGPQ